MRRVCLTMGLAVAMLPLMGCGGAAPAAATTPTMSSSDDDLPAAPTIDGPEAQRLVAAGAFLLDVTPAPRNAESGLPGSTNIPLPELRDRLSEVPRAETVVVYCNGGRGSPRGGAILQAEGYDVRVLGARARWSEGGSAAAGATEE